MKNLGTDLGSSSKKIDQSRDVVFLKDHIVGDTKNSDESQSSPEIPIILTSVSPPVVQDDHGGVGKDNNDGLAEPIKQAPLEPPALPVGLELRISTRE